MKHAIKILLLVAVALLGASCGKTTIIPDDELTNITQEMFLVNAYAAKQKIDTDSIDIYSPILKRYGYNQEDFFNTLANFTQRKSARFGDIIEAAISSLEWHANDYENKVRNLNYIDSLAQAMCKKEVYFAERVKVTRMKDTARLEINIPIVDKGEYHVKYKYHIDTLDKNSLIQNVVVVVDGNEKNTYNTRNHMTRYTPKEFFMKVMPKPGSQELRLKLADYTRKEERPYITIDSVSVVYFPPVEEALRHMDSVMSFKPSLITCDTIDLFRHLMANPPMLSKDSIEAISQRAEEAAKKAAEQKKQVNNNRK